jgi:protein-disulfide isomerase
VTGEPPDAQGLAERRRRRLWLIGATLILAAVLVAIAIAVAGSDDDESGTTTGPPEGAAEVTALYRGVPQRGIELGSPRAEVTMTEFADLQCPFCGQYGREVLPTIVERYVRTGKLRIVFHNLDFLGEDSTEAALMAAAAGRQGKLFEFVDLVYRNQGVENTGWVDDDYLARIGRAVGLDVERAMRERGDPALRAQIDDAKRAAEAAGIDSTPAFLVQRASGRPERLEVEALAPGPFTEALDRAVGEAD